MHLEIDPPGFCKTLESIFPGVVFEFLGQSRNLVFRAHSESGTRILRLSECERVPEAAILAEIAWVGHLQRLGNSVCPALEHDGMQIIPLEIEGSSFFGVFWELSPGRPVRREDLGAELFGSLGNTLARFHAASKSYPANTPRRHWAESSLLCEDMRDYLTNDDREVVHIAEALISKLDGARGNPNSFGLIHADIAFGNFSLTEPGLSVFDFDNCEYSYFARDIAHTLHDCSFTWLRQKDRKNPDESLFHGPALRHYQRAFWDAFAQGYNQANSLPDSELSKMRDFHRLREIEVFVHQNEIWNNTKQDEPYRSYLESDRARIARGGWEFWFDL